MKKLIFTVAILSACKFDKQNLAEVMAKSQVPAATCETGKVGKVDVAICDVPSKDPKDKPVQFLTAYTTKGFRAFPLLEEKVQEAPAAPVTAPTATPDAGVGTGSGKK